MCIRDTCCSVQSLSTIIGESGLVYRGYLKRGTTDGLVAVKTGKGIQSQQSRCNILCFIELNKELYYLAVKADNYAEALVT